MIKTTGRRALFLTLTVLAVCLFCSCGQAQNETGNGSEIKKETEMETEIQDESISRETPQPEEEPAAEEKQSAYALTIHSGDEFALMRERYNWDNARHISVVFSEELSDWREEDLEALTLLKGTVFVENSAETFPARALTYLTGAEELIFSMDTDLSDVTGDLPDGAQLPEQINSVTLYQYREGKYTTLLHTLERSQVETITVQRGADEENLPGFWLDDVAKIASLEELILEDIPIRVREKASLSACPLRKIEGYVDADTDMGFVEKLANLEEASCGVLEELDLSPFLEKEGLSLYLYFCRQTAECEESGYEGESYIVCPAFNRAVGWPGEPSDEKFPAIYQRRTDQGRVVECFTERFLSYNEEKISNMWNYIPWIRVTDGSTVYELRPEEKEGVEEDFDLGSFRTDRMSLRDINFDGVKDIVLRTGGFGAQMLNYEYGWIWDQAGGVYEYSPTYRLIGNPAVDQEHQIVRSFWRNSAGSHGWAIYRYEGGAFVEKSVLTEEFLLADEIPEELAAPDVVEVIRWREEMMENGEVAEVKDSYAVKREGEETVYPDAYESYYAEDSYWADSY